MYRIVYCSICSHKVTEQKGNEMTHSIEYANWATGKIDFVKGCTVVAGPANNELLKDSENFTRAVRPLKSVTA